MGVVRERKRKDDGRRQRSKIVPSSKVVVGLTFD